MRRGEALRWLMEKREQLARELEAIDQLIQLLEKCGENGGGGDIVVEERNGYTRIVFPQPLELDEIKTLYMEKRLTELFDKSYELIRDRKGRVKGVILEKPPSEKALIELRSMYKALASP